VWGAAGDHDGRACASGAAPGARAGDGRGPGSGVDRRGCDPRARFFLSVPHQNRPSFAPPTPSLTRSSPPPEYFRLRTQHRIVGVLVGGLPGYRQQDAVHGLPLQLSPEEVTLCLARGWAELYSLDADAALSAAAAVPAPPPPAPAPKKPLPAKGWGARSALPHNAKRQKRDALAGTEPWTAVLRTPSARVDTPCVSERDGEISASDWSFPRLDSERRRCAVFAHMHARGATLTSGAKFGAEYLAYPGDPAAYHASFTVRVMDGDGEAETGKKKKRFFKKTTTTTTTTTTRAPSRSCRSSRRRACPTARGSTACWRGRAASDPSRRNWRKPRRTASHSARRADARRERYASGRCRASPSHRTSSRAASAAAASPPEKSIYVSYLGNSRRFALYTTVKKTPRTSVYSLGSSPG